MGTPRVSIFKNHENAWREKITRIYCDTVIVIKIFVRYHFQILRIFKFKII